MQIKETLPYVANLTAKKIVDPIAGILEALTKLYHFSMRKRDVDLTMDMVHFHFESDFNLTIFGSIRLDKNLEAALEIRSSTDDGTAKIIVGAIKTSIKILLSKQAAP